MSRSHPATACLIGALLAAPHAAPLAHEAQAAPAALEATPALKAAVDPATGQVRPLSPAESRALDAAVNPLATNKSGALARLQAARPASLKAGDARIRVLGPEHLPMARATRLDDGHVAADCVDPSHAHTAVRARHPEGASHE